MPNRVAEIQPEVEPRQHYVYLLPMIDTDRHAVGWRPVDAIGSEIADVRRSIRQRTRCGDGVSHRGLLDVGRDYANGAELRRHLGQHRDSRTVNAVVVRNEDPHGYTASCKRSAG